MNLIYEEFTDHLDFWLKGQKRGFAGGLKRKELPDGSKIVALHEHPRLYVDRWYGSDLGGGQTILYVLSSSWDPDHPSDIAGTPVARLGYSGEIVERFVYDTEEKEKEQLKRIFGTLDDSEIVWQVLKKALSEVTRERPLRGPGFYYYPQQPGRDQPHPVFGYTSNERIEKLASSFLDGKDLSSKRIVGKETIWYRYGQRKNLLFTGNYDFTLVKKNLEDSLL